MVRITQFYGVKGGQGTSTVAALYALETARMGMATHVFPRPNSDMLAIFGMSSRTDPELEHSITIEGSGLTYGFEIPVVAQVIVTDGIVSDRDFDQLLVPGPRTTTQYLVTRLCFLALQGACKSIRRPDGIVVIAEQGRALQDKDVEDCVGAPVVASLQYDPAIARAIDAGLLATRTPRAAREISVLAQRGVNESQ